MNKVVIKIDSNYEAKAYRYGFDDPKPRWSKNPYKHDLENWDDAIKKAVKNNNACPKYIVQGQRLNSLNWSVKTWAYFSKEKRDKRLEEFNHWYANGTTTELSKDSGAGSGSNGNNNLEDKDEGTSNVENNQNEDIREFKKTYELGNFSDSSNGKSVILYTKYNFTTDTSLSTQISIPNYDGPLGFIYNGDINSFSQNVIIPIVKENKWPENLYCGKISATLLVANTARVIIGTANNGDMVCSNDKNAFIDSTNGLSGFEDQNNSNNPGDYDDLIDIDGGNDNPEQYDDVCAIFMKEDGSPSETLKQIQDIVGYVQIGTIFLILVLGMLDFTGAIGSGEDNAFKKAGSKFLKRLIAGALVFLIPAILGIILNLVSIANGCEATIFK